MAREFKLPDLGEGIHEGEVVSVLVSVGDEVGEGDPLLEVETDKAAVEIPSPYTGTVEEIRVEAGDVVGVGDVLVVFSDAPAAEGAAVEPKPGKKAEAGTTPPEAAQEKEPGSQEPKEAGRPPAAAGGGRPVPASPSTRRLALQLGVDLGQVPASGPAGRVTAQDVRRYAEEKTEPAKKPKAEAGARRERRAATGTLAQVEVPELPDFSRWGNVRRVPVRSIRRATARQMALSWSQVPHVTSQDEADITDLEALRKRHKAAVEKEGGRLTFTVFAVKAIASALKRFEHFNASLDTETDELIVKEYIHVGVATATDDGLIVPVVRDVDRKSIADLAVELADLSRRTRERKAGLEEMQGGSITLTNIGAIGGGNFTPIINYPQVAIVGTGAAKLKPVVRETADGGHCIVARLMMPMVVAIDHRVLDGADSVRFLRTIIGMIEDPEKMLLNIS